MGLDVLKLDMKDKKSSTHNEKSYLSTLDDVSGACEAALEVVNDFLLFDKIASNNLTVELAPLDLVDLVASVVKAFQIQVRHYVELFVGIIPMFQFLSCRHVTAMSRCLS